MKGYLLITITYLSMFTVAQALVITEIMYSPEGSDAKREWVEIYNDTDQSADLADYFLLENSVNHGITHHYGLAELDPGSYAVIANDAKNFREEYGDISSIYDSVFTLNNTGEEISLIDADFNVVSTVNYLNSWGADGDGNSLNLVDTNWLPRKPTPGKLVTEQQHQTGVITNSNTSRRLKKIVSSNDGFNNVATNSIPNHGLTGQKIKFSYQNLQTKHKCTWQISVGKTSDRCEFNYSFELPGTYGVNLYVTYKGKLIDEISRSIIIEEPKVRLLKGLYNSKTYLKLNNQNESSLDLSNWSVLVGLNQRYTFPSNLILNSGTDYAFYIDELVSYPIVVSDGDGQVVLEVNKPTQPKLEDINYITDSKSNDLPVNLDSQESGKFNDPDESYMNEQANLRNKFEGYKEVSKINFVSSDAVPDNFPQDHSLTLANTADSESGPNNAINHIAAIIFGSIASLLFISSPWSQGFRLNQSTNEPEDDTITAKDIDIIEIDDEDF